VDLASEKSQLEPIHADMDAVASLLKENVKLRELLYNPVVEGDKKKAVVAKIAKEAGFNTYTLNFMNLLIRKDRMALLDEICESFEEQYCKLTDTQVSIATSFGLCFRSVAEHFLTHQVAKRGQRWRTEQRESRAAQRPGPEQLPDTGHRDT
jgi:ATP synthase F1 delta subunit